MRLLCRYAVGLACLVTALALVACGGGPGSQPEPKEIGNIAFQQGEKVRTIPLSDKFTGSDLTYSATTSAPSVATVTVDNAADTLTVTAVGAGTATITVTAKNSQGEAKQTFTVTVPKPPAPDPVEIPDIPSLEEGASSRPIPLGDKFSGENLTYAASSSNERVATVSVNNTADTLTVTAVGAGTATITVTAKAQGSATQTKTFTVTVPQPEVAPTVRTRAITSVSVAQGGTRTVTLSTVFTGANLTYVVSSSADTVATASESGGTLTITGVSVGDATVTVTATNTAGRSPAHAMAVTVTAAATTPPTTTTPTSSTLTIERNESAKRTLTAGQTLKSPDKAAVDVERDTTETGNVWIITALRKGTYTITIFNGDGTPAGNIEVVIPNSLPLRLHQTPDGATPLPNPVVCDATDASPCGAPSSVTDGRFETTGLVLTTYFEDPDPDDGDTNDPLRYKVENNLPSWILMDAKNGFASLPATGQLTFEVLEEQLEEDRKFTVTLYAVDDSGGTSQRPVVLELTALAGDPYESDYTVRQALTGALNRDGALKVGPRIDSWHTLTFNMAADNHAGFRFASLKAQALYDVGDLFLETGTVEGITTDNTADSLFVDGAVNIPTWAADLRADPSVTHDVNSDYYLLKSSGDVEVRWDASDSDLDGNPKIGFRLTGTGRGTITIEYHVWKYTGSDELISTTKGNAADKAAASITLDVVTCNSPPDPLSDCPGAKP